MKAIVAERLFDGREFAAATTVLIEGGVIAEVLDAPPRGVDIAQAKLLVPGFIDLQVNGGGGVMFNADPTQATLGQITRAHARAGTTSILATFITDDTARREAAIASVRAAMAQALPGLAGLHLEGPFISPHRPGIHRKDAIATLGPEGAASLSADFPLLITLAPECVETALITRLTEAGAVVFAGHTEADPARLAAAVEAGLTGCTHLWNAMPPLASRAPGPVGGVFALAAEGKRLFAGLIADGYHVDEAPLRATVAALGPGRAFLISDAMATAASDVTSFELDGRRIRLVDGRLADAAGTLAGAHLTMAEALRRARVMGLAAEAGLLRMVTSTPAAAIRLADRGRIAPGLRADLVALDTSWQVTAVWQGGERLP